MSALLRLLQLSNPTLPIGAYAYSQGAESAIDAQLVVDETTALCWIQDILQSGFAYGDLALLHHFYQAWSKKDCEKLQAYAELSVAIRETAELKQEDQHLATALLRLAEPLKVTIFDACPYQKTYPLVFAGFACHWKIPLDETMQGFAWSWVENQLAAMIKLIPLGQTQGQKMMLALDAEIQSAVALARQVPIESIGASLMNFAILSSQHEIQYSRLFRS